MDERTRQVRLQYWMKTIQSWSESELPKKRWCEENGVSLRQFYYWQRIIRQKLCKASKPAAELVAASTAVPCLVDVSPRAEKYAPAEQNAQSMATIRTDRLEIHVPADASEALLECIKGIVCHAL